MFAIVCRATGQESDSLNLCQNRYDFSIKWVSQFPEFKEEPERDNERKGLFGLITGNEKRISNGGKNSSWLSSLLFGKEEEGLVKPMAVTAINPDTFWIADQGNGTVLQVFNQVGEVNRSRNKDIHLTSVVGSCLMTGGRICFTDSRLNRIFQLEPGSRSLKALNDSLLLDRPTGIAYSKRNRELWVVETGAHRVTVLNENGEVVKRFGKRGDGPGEFNFPTHIWIDNKGNIFVVDALNYRVQVFDIDANYISQFGEIGDGSGYFARPKGIATDSYGHIYVADALFHTVQIFDMSGKYLYAFGSQGTDKQQFWLPTGIYIDAENYIYVADSYNSRIQIFKLVDGKNK